MSLTRRQVAAGLGAAAAGGLASGPAASAGSTWLVDSHVHVMSDDRRRYPPTALTGDKPAAAQGDLVTVARLVREMQRCAVSRVGLVQKVHTYAFDNRLVIDSARRQPLRFIPIVAVDGMAPDAGRRAAYWLKDQGAVGVRLTAPWSRGDPVRPLDVSWFSGDAALDVWRTAADLDAPVVLHFYAWNRLAALAALSSVMAAYPTVRVAIDHLSNTPLKTAADPVLDAALLSFADRPQAHLKFSTINFRAWHAAGQSDETALKTVAASFGVERMMWGSDFGNSEGEYVPMVDAARKAVAGFTSSAQAALLVTTAQRFLRRPR